MKFTFGIITAGNDNRISKIIDSIEMQNINDEYEVIVVGNCNVKRDKTKIIPFDESKKRMWITRKKNLITKESSFDNIVYMHDYIKLGDDWYSGFERFGDNFKVCMTKMVLPDGSRFRDWTIWAGDIQKLKLPSQHCLLPYDITHLSKYMYISGAYWIAKKEVMEEFPLKESLVWGQGEDVEWSSRLRKKYNFSINTFSKVKLMKNKNVIFKLINDKDANRLREIGDE